MPRAWGSPEATIARMSGAIGRRIVRRGLQITIGGVLLVCAAWLLGAPAIGRYLGRQLVARAEADWRVEARLESAELGRNGELRLKGLSLTDLAGRQLLELGELRVNPSFRALLGGRISADVDLKQLLVDLRRGADGSLNWSRLKRETQPGDDAEDEGSQGADEGDTDLSAYALAARWSDVSIRLADGDTAPREWAGLEGVFEWDGATGQGHMKLDGAMVDGAAPAGALHVAAQLNAPGGILNGASEITAELDLQRMALAPLGFMLAADARPTAGELSGAYRIEGRGNSEWQWDGEGRADDVQMNLDGSPLLLPSASLIAANESGRPALEFALGEALRLRSLGLPLGEDSMQWQFNADLTSISALKPGLLGGELDGELAGSGELRELEAGGWNSTLDVSAPRVTWDSKDSAPIVQEAIGVAGSIVVRAGADLELENLELKTDSLRANAKGPISAPKVEFEAQLEQLAQDFDFESSGLGGRLLAQLNLTSSDSAWELLGKASVEDFQVEVDSQTSLHDPELSIDIDALIDGTNISLRRVGLDGELLRGEIRGQLNQVASSKQWLMPNLEAEFDYIPDSLARQLSELLPVAWGGSEPAGISLQLESSEPADSLVSVLDQSSGKGVLGLGRLVVMGLEVQGQLDWELNRGSFHCSTAIDSGGGRVLFDLTTPLGLGERKAQVPIESGPATQIAAPVTAPAATSVDGEAAMPVTRVHFTVEDVTVGQAVAPLLARVHPLFALYSPGDDEDFKASVQSDFQVELPVPLLQWLAEGQQLNQLRVRGLLQASDVLLGEDGTLAQLITEVAGKDHGELRLRPLEFQLEGGQLRYLRPWTWTIGEVETSFIGSVGLDGEVSLDWTMPITQSLADSRNLPDFLVGRVFEVPIRGSMKSPRVGIVDAISSLVKSSFGSGLQESLQESLQGIAPAGGKGAAELLQEADKLWDAGKTSEAAVIYRQLRSEHKLSAIYLFNKSRIKSRSRTE